MNAIEEITVNLDLSPAERWKVLEKHKSEIDELLGYYLKDLGDVSFFKDAIEYYKAAFISKEYLEEIRCIAGMSVFTENDILITNLYYDALKFVFGCTSFAVAINDSVIHARNLDWWTENDALGNHTKLFHFAKNGQIAYSAVSWPGFVGVLSGMKPGKFSVTLNAVSSRDSPHLAPPVTLLVRETLEKADSFAEAKKMLSETEIASDCLLMLVGTEEDEMVVIERTPKRFAIRKPNRHYLVVTNDYRQLDNEVKTDDVLQQTSCGRFDRTSELLESAIPQTEDDFFSILNDEKVKMSITVQQMVFNPKHNKIAVVV